MKVFKFVVDDLSQALDFLELYCIRKEISYVKLADEFHFLDYIFKLYSREEFLTNLFLQGDVNSASTFFGILNCDESRNFVNESLRQTNIFFVKRKKNFEKEVKKNYKVNTLGYPKKIRRR